MSRRDDPDDGPDDDEADEAPAPSSRRASRRPAGSPRARRRPVARWKGPDGDEEEDEDDELVDDATPRRRRFLRREDHPIYWRARDSLYFEPLVAVAIIVVLLAGLYAYTQNWPPIYVVESGSMQHGSADVLGVINTGDLVLAQRIPTDQITTYVVGLQTGFSTYGEYGDVILYLPDGQGSTPIIHRSIVFLQYNSVLRAYNATGLSGLPCGLAKDAVYSTANTTNDCGTTDLTSSLSLYRIGWQSVNVTIELSPGILGAHSGFVTMGDNNYQCTSPGNCYGETDQLSGLSQLVEPGWIIGVARGMLPWFGALKLAAEGRAGSVPPQSWQFLALTVIGVILLAFGIHYALRIEGVEDPRRRAEEEEAIDEEEEDEPPPGRARRFFRGLRPWGRTSDEEDEEPPAHGPARKSHASPPPKHRGRPVPRVRRGTPPKRRRDSDDDL